MQMRSTALLLGTLAAVSLCIGGAGMGQDGRKIQRPAKPEIGEVRVAAFVLAPRNTDPRTDAETAIRAGDFRLFVAGRYSGRPVGVLCFTPGGRATGVLSRFERGDSITPDIQAELDYESAYNIAIVESPSYADADICRPARAGDPRPDNGKPLVDRAARAVSGPVRSLHEAARRGSAADILAFLPRTPANMPDGTGMTPLAWAAARNNMPALSLLLEQDEDPWFDEARREHGAVYWAAAAGWKEAFDRLRRVPRPAGFDGWSSDYLAAAMNSGNAAIVEAILVERHAPLRVPFFRSELPPAVSVEPVLREGVPRLSDALLLAAIDRGERIQLDLVRLALKYRANPNATRNYGETPLGLAAYGYREGAIEAVDLLLKAGADIDLPSVAVPVAPRRPIWNAVATLSQQKIDVASRPFAILKMLAAAGADLNLPNRDGKPPVWFLLAPARWAPEQIDATPGLIQLLPILAKLGMNPNARWQGKTILPLAERQLGRDAPLVVALRAAGAR